MDKEWMQTALRAVLPALPEDEASQVAEHLVNDVGVVTTDDLKFVQPNDLPQLKPIQVQKLIQACLSEITYLAAFHRRYVYPRSAI